MATRHKTVKTDSKRKDGSEIQAPKGKLGVMIPGMGAVATTFVAGVEAVRKGFATPIGSLTQMGTVRLGRRTEGRSPKVNEFVPLAGLNDLVLLVGTFLKTTCTPPRRTPACSNANFSIK